MPKVDVLVSAIFRSQPNAQPGAAVGTNGASRSATYRMTAAQFLAATGRPLARRVGHPGRRTSLLPGAVYGDRVNAVDMRFAKVLRFGKTKANVGLDLYNLFNSNTPTTYETVYDPATNGAKWMHADGRAAAAVHAVQRPVRLLNVSSVRCRGSHSARPVWTVISRRVRGELWMRTGARQP